MIMHLAMRIVLHWLDQRLPPALVPLVMFAIVVVSVELLLKPSAKEVLVEERQGQGEDLKVSSQTALGRPFNLKAHVLRACHHTRSEEASYSTQSAIDST